MRRTKQKIITVLWQMHRSKESLAYATARHDAPALVSAAGIDQNLYFAHYKSRKPGASDKR